MVEKIYNKLVRDRIPEIIKKTNNEPVTHIASIEETKVLLLKKLIEELNEFENTPIEEEMADMLEVIDGIIDLFNLDIDKVKEIKKKKRDDRGGFNNRIVLEKVVEKY